MRILKCRCRSVWCKKCAKVSPTNDRIREKLTRMDWKKVRHIVLTVDRRYNAQGAYQLITQHKTIPRMIRRLQSAIGRWLWVLEFHADGYPHWHLLAESYDGMVGKKHIDDEWGWGFTWESYIKSEEHWKATAGYHKSKGYLAGENKKHQLELPDYLLSESRVRKFGSRIDRENVPRGTCATSGRKRAKARPLRERLAHCGEGIKIQVGCQWREAPADYTDSVRIAGANLQRRNKGMFEGDGPAVIATANRILCREK